MQYHLICVGDGWDEPHLKWFSTFEMPFVCLMCANESPRHGTQGPVTWPSHMTQSLNSESYYALNARHEIWRAMTLSGTTFEAERRLGVSPLDLYTHHVTTILEAWKSKERYVEIGDEAGEGKKEFPFTRSHSVFKWCHQRDICNMLFHSLKYCRLMHSEGQKEATRFHCIWFCQGLNVCYENIKFLV